MASFARCSLSVMNSIFLVCGIILFSFGIWIVVDDDYLVKFGTVMKIDMDTILFSGIRLILEEVQEAGYVFMGCGIGIFLISILGFCGAIRQSVCNLIAYCIFVAILVLVQIGMVNFIIYNKQQLYNMVSTKTVNMLANQYVKTSDTSNEITFALDVYQMRFGCCGVNGPGDYAEFHKFRDSFKDDDVSNVIIVPKTCCDEHNSNKQYVTLTEKYVCSNGQIQKGCIRPLFEKMLAVDNWIIGVAVVVVLIEIIGIVMALYVVFHVNKDPEYQQMK